MFGGSMTWPEGSVRELEEGVLARFMERDRLETTRHLGEGTRRPLRLALHDARAEQDPAAGSITLSFVLPKGGYATTVLTALCRTREIAAGPAADPGAGEDSKGSEE
jgi:tRNA pseudouridine13 synthase